MSSNFTRKGNSKQKGFTLLEMIISLGIFTVVALIAVGALVRIMDLNRKSINLKAAINNANFALESMSREMRVGKNYYCTNGTTMPPVTLTTPSGNCPTNAANTATWMIAFNSTKVSGTAPNDCNLIYAYRIRYSGSTGILEKAQQSDCSTAIAEANFQPVVSSDVIITNSRVNVMVTDQPRVFLWFKGYSGTKTDERSTFIVQTTISQRIR